VIRILQSWGVPVVMTGAYAVLMWSSDTDTTGKAWMAIGLAMVLVVWWLFRTLTAVAALSRAVAVGDVVRTLELVDEQLPRRKQPAARAPLFVARARALELRGDWAGVIAALDAAAISKISEKQRPTWQIFGASARIGALLETGEVADAKRILETELVPATTALDPRVHRTSQLHVSLAIGRVAAAEGRPDEAKPLLQAVLDDIHAGGALRALAHFYLARIETEPVAAKHRAEIAKLIPDETLWIRTGR
jgi:hypothetical protein